MGAIPVYRGTAQVISNVSKDIELGSSRSGKRIIITRTLTTRTPPMLGELRARATWRWEPRLPPRDGEKTLLFIPLRGDKRRIVAGVRPSSLTAKRPGRMNGARRPGDSEALAQRAD